MDLESLRYPIGRLKRNQEWTEANKEKWIETIRQAPQKYKAALEGLSQDQLDTAYRPDGWTIRQVVHHVADSHINSYVRFKWTLTEEKPLIKAYKEKLWAELPDAKTAPISLSLDILEILHKRWVYVLGQMTESDFSRELGHPDWENNLSLKFMLSLYAWHCEHHLAHITGLKERMGW